MTPQEWQNRAIAETGGTSQNAKFGFGFIFGTDGGTFAAAFNGFETLPINFPNSAAQLQGALETLPTIQLGGAVVSGPIAGPFEVELIGGNAGQVVPPLLIDGSLLEPPQEVEVEEMQQGFTRDFSTSAAQYWTDHAGKANELLRFLWMKKDLIELRLGSMVDDVDTETGQVNRVVVKSSQRLAALERMLLRVMADIQAETNKLAVASRGIAGADMTTKTPNGLPYGVLGITPDGRLY